MMNPEVYEKTRQLIKALNFFMIHILIYLSANIALALYTFGDIRSRWGWLFLIVCWALALIYHGLRVYGIDPFSKDRNPQFLSAMFKMIGT